jgi:hypothetical protein
MFFRELKEFLGVKGIKGVFGELKELRELKELKTNDSSMKGLLYGLKSTEKLLSILTSIFFPI